MCSLHIYFGLYSQILLFLAVFSKTKAVGRLFWVPQKTDTDQFTSVSPRAILSTQVPFKAHPIEASNGLLVNCRK